jgi:hypothetical protein
MVAVKRKQIKIELLLPAILFLTVAGAGGMLIRPVENPDHVLPARFGDVEWNHELHARMKEYNCQVCHHTERQGTTTPKPCHDCHALLHRDEALVLADLYLPGVEEQPGYTVSGEQGPPAMEAFHAKCAGCHQAVKEGPVGCRDCHAQSFTGPHGTTSWNHRLHSRQMNQLDCEDCHHQDPEAEWDADYRACGQCHKPVDSLDVDMDTGLSEHEEEVHLKCAFCHTVDDPEAGAATCTECHPGMDPNPEGAAEEDKVPPSREQAIHKKCLECHNAYDPDLRADMPGVCTDCHKAGVSIFEGYSAGPAIWSHNWHRYTELEDYHEYTCDKCHHTDIVGEPHQACDRCHGRDDFFGILNLEQAVHKRCLDCHEEEARGPLECTGCHSENRDELIVLRGESGEGVVWWSHASHADNMAFSCRECHHNAIIKDGFSFTACESVLDCPENAPDPQPCEACHVRTNDFDKTQLEWMLSEEGEGEEEGGGALKALSLGEAVHGSCVRCHRKFEAGPAECEECHVKRK